MTTIFSAAAAFLAIWITGAASMSDPDRQKLVKFADFYKPNSLTLRGLAFPGFRPYAYLNILSHEEIGTSRDIRMKVRVRYQTNELVAAAEPEPEYDPDNLSFDYSAPAKPVKEIDPVKEAAAAAERAATVMAAMATYPEGLKDGNLVLYLEASLDVKGGLTTWEVSREASGAGGQMSPATFTYATGDEEPKAVPKETNKVKLNKLKEHTIAVLPAKFQEMLRKAQTSATWTRALNAQAEEQAAFLGDATRKLLTSLVQIANNDVGNRLFHVSDAMKEHGYNEIGRFENWSISPKNKLEFTAMYFTDGGVGKRQRYPTPARKAHAVLLIKCAAAAEGSTSTNFRVLLDQSKTSVEVAEYQLAVNEKVTDVPFTSLKNVTPLVKPNNLDSKAGREYESLIADTVPEVAKDMKNKLRIYLQKIWKL